MASVEAAFIAFVTLLCPIIAFPVQSLGTSAAFFYSYKPVVTEEHDPNPFAPYNNRKLLGDLFTSHFLHYCLMNLAPIGFLHGPVLPLRG